MLTDDDAAVRHFLRGQCPVVVAVERWLSADPPVAAQKLVGWLLVTIIRDVVSGPAVWRVMSRADFDRLLPWQREAVEQHVIEHEMVRRVTELVDSGSEPARLAIRSNAQKYALQLMFGTPVVAA